MGNQDELLKEKVLNPEVVSVITKVMAIEPEEIKNITYLKQGMTNDSFKFEVKDKSYIIRVPGAGTDKLINRSNEYNVYGVLKGKKISDNIIYISNDSGIKITEFWETARVSDPFDKQDVERCMDKLREFHNSDLKVSHFFDPFKEIKFYESLWKGKPSMFEDYIKVKERIMSLEKLIVGSLFKIIFPFSNSFIDSYTRIKLSIAE